MEIEHGEEEEEEEDDEDEEPVGITLADLLQFLAARAGRAGEPEEVAARLFLMHMMQRDGDRTAQTHEELVDKVFRAQTMWGPPQPMEHHRVAEREEGDEEDREREEMQEMEEEEEEEAEDDGIIGTESAIYKTMRSLPRGWFVPREFQSLACNDMPLDMQPVLPTNLSAAHIYPKLLQLLHLNHLDKGKSIRVLDIGCGTGYLSCAVAILLGPGHEVEGWDVHDSVIHYANKVLQEHGPSMGPMSKVTYRTWNAFWTPMHNMIGQYDRIHIGAAILHKHKDHFVRLLKVGGVLVSPIEDGLFQIRKLDQYNNTSERCASQVRYRSLLPAPQLPYWTPEAHILYPEHVRKQIFEALCIWTLCPESPFASVPREILFRIFSFVYSSNQEEED